MEVWKGTLNAELGAIGDSSDKIYRTTGVTASSRQRMNQPGGRREEALLQELRQHSLDHLTSRKGQRVFSSASLVYSRD